VVGKSSAAASIVSLLPTAEMTVAVVGPSTWSMPRTPLNSSSIAWIWAIVSTVKTVSGASTRTMKNSCEPKTFSALRIRRTVGSLSGKYLPKSV
jgi:hypothetical protein